MLAIRSNRYETAQELIRQGADLAATSGKAYAYTALHELAGTLNDDARDTQHAS